MKACAKVSAFTILVTVAPNEREREMCISLLKSSLSEVVDAVESHASVLTNGFPTGVMSNIIGRA